MTIVRAARRLLRVLASNAQKKVLRAVCGAPQRVGDGVALTYDDGPHPQHTSSVLDVLQRHGATATFFVVGERALQHPELVRRMVAEGHVVGTHSMHHRDLRRLPVAEAWKEITDGVAAVETIVGAGHVAFRPPHGGLTLRMAERLRRSPLSVWMWSLNSDDWKAGMTSADVAERVASCRRRDIVLFHDTLAATAHTTELVLQGLTARGMQTVTL